MANQYRLRVGHGEDIFEAEGDKRFVIEMLSRFGEGKKIPSLTSSNAPAQKANGNGKPLSVSEFVRSLSLKTHTDRVLAFGYYLEKYAGQERFTVADINKCYYDAKLETSNSSMMIRQNIKRGLMMDAKADGGKRAGFTLTNGGEEYVATKLKSSGE